MTASALKLLNRSTETAEQKDEEAKTKHRRDDDSLPSGSIAVGIFLLLSMAIIVCIALVLPYYRKWKSWKCHLVLFFFITRIVALNVYIEQVGRRLHDILA
jgi:hypothetical protein